MYLLASSATALLIVGLTPATVRGDTIADLFNTGVDATGTLLGDLVDDPHYTLVADPSGLGDATVPNNGFPIGPWLANDGNSRWIGPANPDTDGSGPAGNYIYETTFTLPVGTDFSSVVISGLWATDDGGVGILLNGVTLNEPASTGFGGYTGFDIAGTDTLPTPNFQVGVNTLQFSLSNGGGPTGLRVDDMVGTFVPEPASAAVLALGGLGLMLRRRR